MQPAVRTKIVSSGSLGVEVPAESETEIPVTIDFGEGAKIVGPTNVKKSERVGDELQETVLDEVTAVVDARKIVLKPILLNPGVILSIWTFVSNLQPRRPNVTATIKDVRMRREVPADVLAQAAQASTSGTRIFVSQLLREPVLFTFPLAYLAALTISGVLGGADWTKWVSAGFVSLLIYSADWYAADHDWSYPREYIGHLIYVFLNTAILVLLLKGAIFIGKTP